jgi:sugar phosphate isomerase/epimerase
MQKSVDATLARLAQIGYKELEFAGYFDKTPDQVAALLKANGLTAPSAHVPREMMGKGWEKVLDGAGTIGHKWVVIPYLQAHERKTADDYKKLAAEMNVAAAAAKKRGINFAYHNHDFEFIPFGNTNGYEILMKECDPKLVMFELDLFWITKAGRDAATHVAQHANRVSLVHVKDMKADGTMTEVGSGTVPFQKIFTAAKGGIKHFFVEHDNPGNAFDSVSKSLAALKGYSA